MSLVDLYTNLPKNIDNTVITKKPIIIYKLVRY